MMLALDKPEQIWMNSGLGYKKGQWLTEKAWVQQSLEISWLKRTWFSLLATNQQGIAKLHLDFGHAEQDFGTPDNIINSTWLITYFRWGQ